MKALSLMIAIIFLLVAGCSESTQSENPQWVDQLIKKFQKMQTSTCIETLVFHRPTTRCDQHAPLRFACG